MHILSTICAKGFFGNVDMTSYCDITKSAHLVIMTTMRHCSILDFGKGEYKVQKF